jgi:hypothetical protein
MPVRPDSIVRATLGGILLAGSLALPLFAQTETPPTTPAPLAPLEPSRLPPAGETPATAQPAETPADGTTPPAEPADATTTRAADLAEVEASLQLSRERIDALKAEIAEMESVFPISSCRNSTCAGASMAPMPKSPMCWRRSSAFRSIPRPR